MLVSAIKAQVKNPNRVSIYIDGQYSFSLNPNQLLEQKLRVGLEITAEQLADLQRASQFGKYLDRALNYATIRPRSEKEFLDYARRKKWDPQEAQDILGRLVRGGYIDNRRFTRAWVENRQLNKPVSRRRLVLELKQKGVPEQIISEVLSERAFDEQESLRRLIDKKRKLTRYQDDDKLTRYLLTQGFRYEDVRKAMMADV